MTQEDRMIVCIGCGAVNRVPMGKPLGAGKCGRCAAALATPEPVDISDQQMRPLEQHDTGAFVVDLWAPWCGPCRMMAPGYASTAERLRDDVRFFKLNTDQYPDTGARLRIRGVPTLVAWSGGRALAQQAGAQMGPALERWVRNLFQLSSTPN